MVNDDAPLLRFIAIVVSDLGVGIESANDVCLVLVGTKHDNLAWNVEHLSSVTRNQAL